MRLMMHVVRSLEDLSKLIEMHNGLEIRALHAPGNAPDDQHKAFLKPIDWVVEVEEVE